MSESLCTALISILVAALLASPFMVFAAERMARRRARKRKRPRPPGGGAAGG